MITDGLHDNSFRDFACEKILDVLVPVYGAKGIRVPFVDPSEVQTVKEQSLIVL